MIEMFAGSEHGGGQRKADVNEDPKDRADAGSCPRRPQEQRAALEWSQS